MMSKPKNNNSKVKGTKQTGGLRPSFLGPIPSKDLAWLAGLLEGEGCFLRKGNFGTERNISVLCQMTDLDVLETVLRLVGAGAITGPYSNGLRKDGRPCKPRYSYRLFGAEARDLMERLLPWMGKRRSAAIHKLLAAYDSVSDHIFVLLNVQTGEQETTVNLRQWLQAHDISESGLWRTLVGQRKQCKGWRRLA